MLHFNIYAAQFGDLEEIFVRLVQHFFDSEIKYSVSYHNVLTSDSDFIYFESYDDALELYNLLVCEFHLDCNVFTTDISAEAAQKDEVDIMKVQLVGKRVMDFDTKDGKVAGVKLYLTGVHPDVSGQIADSIWVDKKSPLYGEAAALNFNDGPIPTMLVYEQYIGSTKPVLVAINPIEGK